MEQRKRDEKRNATGVAVSDCWKSQAEPQCSLPNQSNVSPPFHLVCL